MSFGQLIWLFLFGAVMSSSDPTSRLTQEQVAQHLDMSVRNCREVLKTLGIDWANSTLDEIRTAYIRDLREKAAGRGGSQVEQLNSARLKNQRLRLPTSPGLSRKLGTLVPTADAAFALTDWAGYTNREIVAAFEKLVQQLESTLKVDIDRGLVDGIAGPTVKRIGGYAANLGQRIAGGGGAVQSAQGDTFS
ncbi:hypothetical protein UMZ34_24140 [Halopseudomonas pachastrellae]|nr:hypothetical protein UMZ34_24140 [Halopseudomonas pachastrellae]